MKKSIKFYLKISALALLLVQLAACSSPTQNFEDLLYDLIEMTAAERTEALQLWLDQQEGFPVIENRNVYFFYKENRDIEISVCGDFNQWRVDKSQLLKIIGTDYYFFKAELEENACIDYQFYLENRYVNDPLNTKISESQNGTHSLLMMPGFKYPSETLIKRNFIYTSLDTIYSSGKNVAAYLYRHKGASDTSRFVIINDAFLYLDRLQSHFILDNLIEAKTIKPLQALFVNTEIVEPLDITYPDYLFNNLLPSIHHRYNLKNRRLIIGGFSNGGLTGFYALKKYSDRLESIFLQNPDFATRDNGILNDLNDVNFSNTRIYINYSSLSQPDSAFINVREFLKNKDAKIKTFAYNGGTSYLNIKDNFIKALVSLLANKTEFEK